MLRITSVLCHLRTSLSKRMASLSPSPASSTPRKQPLIVILGSTGTGKSDLAISLAKQFNGEVINADAMQLFKGLDIVTNKATPEEMEGIPHHLIGCLDENVRDFTVRDYQTLALTTIQSIHHNGKIPILAGGTNYYIQSILFDALLSSSSSSSSAPLESSPHSVTIPLPELQQKEGESLWEHLKRLDPIMAERLHPNDTRKLTRSIQIIQESNGIPHSQLLLKQKSEEENAREQLRFDCLFLWTWCPKDLLNERLDKRVDKMVSRGLLKEINDFHNHLKQSSASPSSSAESMTTYASGILQSIGYKEFEPFLTHMDSVSSSSCSDDYDKESQKLFDESLDRLKAHTRRYARKQISWLVNRFAVRPSMSLLRFTIEEPSVLKTQVMPIASEITRLWMENGIPSDAVGSYCASIQESHPNLLAVIDKNSSEKEKEESGGESEGEIEDAKPTRSSASASLELANWKKYECELCARTLNGLREWEEHLKSRQHKKKREGGRKRELNEARRRAKLSESESTPVVDDEAQK